MTGSPATLALVDRRIEQIDRLVDELTRRDVTLARADPDGTMMTVQRLSDHEIELSLTNDGTLAINGQWRDIGGGMQAKVVESNAAETLILWHVPPGQALPPHYHAWSESFIVVRGDLTISFAGKTTTMRSGSTPVIVPAGVVHVSVSSVPSLILTVCRPALDNLAKQTRTSP